jgi:Mg-chelatase subunit ChlD
MNSEFVTLPSLVAASSEHTLCAVRLKAPENVERVPTHFILLIDVSSSMEDDEKLEHVKRCAQIILSILNPTDRISLVTFGDSAELILKNVSPDEPNKSVLQERIKKLVPDGCTNLSAGLGLVRTLLEGDTMKSGLLILTDGHANRGISETTLLRNITSALKTDNQNLSIHCVAYGHCHNADLLQGIATDCQGSYNVVASLEDTAIAFGDTLGGLMSCAYQNVVVHLPIGSILRGSLRKIRNEDSGCVVSIGDIYAGTSPLLLADILTANIKDGCVRVEGQIVPSLASFIKVPDTKTVTGRHLDIEIAILRTQCTSILEDIKNYTSLGPAAKEGIEPRIRAFAFATADLFLNASPVIGLLREEIETMRTMLEEVKRDGLSMAQNIMMTQHLTTMSLGRGYNSPVAPQRNVRARLGGGPPGAPRRVRFQRSLSPPGAGGVGDTTADPSPPPPPVARLYTVSAFQNTTQSRLSELIRLASMDPSNTGLSSTHQSSQS